MANKNKTATVKAPAAKPTEKASTAPRSNGGLVFEVADEGFEIPTVAKGSQFEETIRQLKELPVGKDGQPRVVAIFRKPYAEARKVYTKSKAFQVYAERAGEKVNAAVRKDIKTGEAVLWVGMQGEEQAEASE